jgi:hypothetical protein
VRNSSPPERKAPPLPMKGPLLRVEGSSPRPWGCLRVMGDPLLVSATAPVAPDPARASGPRSRGNLRRAQRR